MQCLIFFQQLNEINATIVISKLNHFGFCKNYEKLSLNY